MSHSSQFYLNQLYYSSQTRAQLDVAFSPLDNTKPAREDWYEIWPILEYFATNRLGENDWYGFFSPRFEQKTGFTGRHVRKALKINSSAADAIVFSAPVRRQFNNVFQQGEASHRGLIDICHRLFQHWGLEIDLNTTPFKPDHAVFSNYFVAKGAVWAMWTSLAKSLIEISDNPDHPLSASLNLTTTYRGDFPEVKMKVFIAERLISLLFHLNPEIRVKAIRPSDPCKWLPRPLRSLVGCRRRT